MYTNHEVLAVFLHFDNNVLGLILISVTKDSNRVVYGFNKILDILKIKRVLRFFGLFKQMRSRHLNVIIRESCAQQNSSWLSKFIDMVLGEGRVVNLSVKLLIESGICRFDGWCHTTVHLARFLTVLPCLVCIVASLAHILMRWQNSHATLCKDRQKLRWNDVEVDTVCTLKLLHPVISHLFPGHNFHRLVIATQNQLATVPRMPAYRQLCLVGMITAGQLAGRIFRADVYQIRTLPRLLELFVHQGRTNMDVRVIVYAVNALTVGLDQVNLPVIGCKLRMFVAALPLSELEHGGGLSASTLLTKTVSHRTTQTSILVQYDVPIANLLRLIIQTFTLLWVGYME